MSDDDLRVRLREEMSSVQRPPLAGLVESAVVRGHRAQWLRRLASGLGAVAIGAAVTVFMFGGQLIPDRGGSTAELEKKLKFGAAGRPTGRDGDGTVVPREQFPIVNEPIEDSLFFMPGRALKKTAAPVGVPATAHGLLELLTRQLPAGKTSNYGQVSAGFVRVQLYVQSSRGVGMLRVSLFQATRTECPINGKGTCETWPSGDRVTVLKLPGKCLQATVVEVIHSDGSGVQFDLGTCLDNGRPSPLAVTVEKAIAMGRDKRMNMSMDKRLVADGAKNFPTLRVFR